ncbi:MAG: glutaminyl-peptide cyclotransferase [Candidatus Krumholzibacteriia bacterium]
MNLRRCSRSVLATPAGALAAASLAAILALSGGCGDDGDPTAPDTIAVRPGDPLLEVEPTYVGLGLARSRDTLRVSNRGGGLLHWSATTAASWVQLSPTTGTAALDTDIVVVTVDRTALPPGLAIATLVVTAGEQAVSRTLTATAVTEPVWSWRILASYPHDPQAFTQGLTMVDGVLYEGTGLYGASTLRRVDLETGAVLQRFTLPDEYFGEGIAVIAERIVQLTWLSGVGFVYDRATFAPLGTFTYGGQGWGLAFDGERLIMSDGTAGLRFLDPITYAPLDTVTVTGSLGPVTELNELEVIGDEVWANVWRRDHIVRIDAADGRVTGWIDLMELRASLANPTGAGVLNGIARDAATGRILVTGKNWPRLFAIELVPAS